MKSSISLLALVLTFAMPLVSCNGGPSGDWADLPDHLEGGIVIYGDSRSGHETHEWLMKGMASLKPAAVFHTGDLVHDGNDERDWLIFNTISSQLPSLTPIYPALGNHEKESALYFENFNLPGNERWYTIDNIDELKFIVLDTESNLAYESSQYQWLESELSSSLSSSKYAIVLFHYPLYSTGYYAEDEKGIRDDVVPLFKKFGVDAVFNGHDHDYERSTVDGIRYIVTGGGGAPLRGQYRNSKYSDLFAKVHHFCVLYRHETGELLVDVWSDSVTLVDRFTIDQVSPVPNVQDARE